MSRSKCGCSSGFGGPCTSGSADIGTAVIYAVVFAGLLTLSYDAGTARYSADYYLEQKFRWWWRLAELRRPAPAQITPGTVSGTSGAIPGALEAPRPGTAPRPSAQHKRTA